MKSQKREGRDENTLQNYDVPKQTDCVKSPLRCHPRESGDPSPANINWILAESSTHFRGNDKTGGVGFHTV